MRKMYSVPIMIVTLIGLMAVGLFGGNARAVVMDDHVPNICDPGYGVNPDTGNCEKYVKEIITDEYINYMYSVGSRCATMNAPAECIPPLSRCDGVYLACDFGYGFVYAHPSETVLTNSEEQNVIVTEDAYLENGEDNVIIVDPTEVPYVEPTPVYVEPTVIPDFTEDIPVGAAPIVVVYLPQTGSGPNSY